MHRFSLENRATRNMAANAGETNADIFRNCSPVGGRMQVLAVESKNSDVVRLAEARRTSGDNFKSEPVRVQPTENKIADRIWRTTTENKTPNKT
jgi:hypothetical protein